LSATHIVYGICYCSGTPHVDFGFVGVDCSMTFHIQRSGRHNILLIGNIGQLQHKPGAHSKRCMMLVLRASCDLEENKWIGVFEGTILTISELMDGISLEDLHLIQLRNVVPVLMPLGSRLVLDGRHSDSKMTWLHHSDDPNCEFSTNIYYQAEAQQTIVPVLLVHTCKAVVVGEIMTVNWSQCRDTLMEWCAVEYTIQQ
jgi:hypothetical protein